MKKKKEWQIKFGILFYGNVTMYETSNFTENRNIENSQFTKGLHEKKKNTLLHCGIADSVREKRRESLPTSFPSGTLSLTKLH